MSLRGSQFERLRQWRQCVLITSVVCGTQAQWALFPFWCCLLSPFLFAGLLLGLFVIVALKVFSGPNGHGVLPDVLDNLPPKLW